MHKASTDDTPKLGQYLEDQSAKTERQLMVDKQSEKKSQVENNIL